MEVGTLVGEKVDTVVGTRVGTHEGSTEGLSVGTEDKTNNGINRNNTNPEIIQDNCHNENNKDSATVFLWLRAVTNLKMGGLVVDRTKAKILDLLRVHHTSKPPRVNNKDATHSLNL